mmetsp:Transcript_25196/g.33446  ORF Transcript_25196/g.33446 Transcript_25196/m.33446 type:complete len:313 (-) Transcript_25196:592-1530(-)
MKSLILLLLALIGNGCNGENFILGMIGRGITNAFSGETKESSDKHSNHSSSSRGLEVISAGLCRTGSASLKKALTILGYTPYHMSEVLANDHSELWDHVVKTGGTDGIDNVISAMVDGGYDATTDCPSADFSLELLERYPDAKVILLTRPEDRWIRSVAQMPPIINYAGSYPPFKFIPRFPKLFTFLKRLHCDHWKGCMLCDGHEHEFDHDQTNVCLDYFRSHNQKVRDAVKVDQLLEFHLSESWEPLCGFLGKPIPTNEPFPHVNSGTSFMIAYYVTRTIILLYYACCAIPVYYIFRRWIIPLGKGKSKIS